MKKLAPYLIVFLIAAIPIFSHLDSYPIRVWDESRLANNAYEMYHNHNYIVSYFYGSPDMWSTKPTLLIAIQAMFMHVVGVNELAIRLPIALATLALCFALLYFSKRIFNSNLIGIAAVLILITTNGFVELHGSRTGDYDLLLILFTTLSCMHFFLFVQEQKIKNLYLFFAFTALAMLTKGVAGLLFWPGIFLFALYSKQVVPLLQNKHTYIGLFSCLAVAASYYVVREQLNPGYWDAVKVNELGGRFFHVIENHDHGFFYYLNLLIDYDYSYWCILIPVAILFGVLIRNKTINKLSLFTVLLVLSYFLIISTAKTKVPWYNLPMYPFLALLIAMLLYMVYEQLKQIRMDDFKISNNFFPPLFLILVFVMPYLAICSKTMNPIEPSMNYYYNEITYYLKKVINENKKIENQFVIYDEYNAHISFYQHMLNDAGSSLFNKGINEIKKGDVIMVSQDHLKSLIEKTYDTKIIDTYNAVVIYQILKFKS
jgi:4-amino-4-deoxy-L-arabinose transferase-like glycosyltransferase